MASDTIIVIPCYNEAERLDSDAFFSFCQEHPTVSFIFVNDGSTDETLRVLENLQDRDSSHLTVLDKPPNQGKAEAVRIGMQEAFRRNPKYAGYWDADLATPLDQIPDFIRVLDEKPQCEFVFGARVQLLGRSIIRHPWRHYLGRVFATVASLVLSLPVYDTQCGAKLLRVSPNITSLFAEPFCTGWIFDVEIIVRLIQSRRGSSLPGPSRVIYEFPLHQWHDIAGSKVRPEDFLIGIFEMTRLYYRYLRKK